MSEALVEAARAAHRARFGTDADAVAFAPGRVNLMGEHTDYNGGCVLPVTLTLGIAVALSRGGTPPGTMRLASDGFDAVQHRTLGEPASGLWSDYAFGSLGVALPDLVAAEGLSVAVTGDLPSGAGLSSSAAIEIACLRAAAALSGAALDPVEAALRARAVENDFVGMPCGVMDQFAVSVGAPGAALFLDTATLAHRAVHLPEGHRFLVVHSGVAHRLADDGYAARVRECRAACDALGVPALGGLTRDALDRFAALEPPLDARARHIVTECDRVHAAVAALDAGDAAAMGRLMRASHASQRDDYAVSVPGVDRLAAGLEAAGALGARLTGGGFGGSVVALVADDARDVVVAAARAEPGARLLAVI